MMQRIRWFLLLFGIIVILVLSLWNSDPVTVQLPFFEDRELPLSMLLMATAASGFIFGAIMTGWMLRSRRKSAESKEKTKAQANERDASASQVAPEEPNPLLQ